MKVSKISEAINPEDIDKTNGKKQKGRLYFLFAKKIMAAIKPIPAPIKKQALWSIKRPIPYPIYRINSEIHCNTKMRSRFFL